MTPTTEEDDQARALKPPRMCTKECGFFANPGAGGLCSRCATREVNRDRQTPVLLLPGPLPLPQPDREADPVPRDREPAAAATADLPSRCALCNKKMPLAMRFGCRCGSVYCTAHRQPEAHACQHDWKTQVRLQIHKANPRVVAARVDKL
jgi:hypothetical protein